MGCCRVGRITFHRCLFLVSLHMWLLVKQDTPENIEELTKLNDSLRFLVEGLVSLHTPHMHAHYLRKRSIDVPLVQIPPAFRGSTHWLICEKRGLVRSILATLTAVLAFPRHNPKPLTNIANNTNWPPYRYLTHSTSSRSIPSRRTAHTEQHSCPQWRGLWRS